MQLSRTPFSISPNSVVNCSFLAIKEGEPNSNMIFSRPLLNGMRFNETEERASCREAKASRCYFHGKEGMMLLDQAGRFLSFSSHLGFMKCSFSSSWNSPFTQKQALCKMNQMHLYIYIYGYVQTSQTHKQHLNSWPFSIGFFLVAMASRPTLKRTESLTDALRQSRLHMKRCFAWYMEKGRRIMKLQQLLEEMEKVIDSKSEREQVLGSDLGFILCYTQVNSPLPRPSFLIWNKIEFIPLQLVQSICYWNNTESICPGSNCHPSAHRFCYQAKSWLLGICQGEVEWFGCGDHWCYWLLEVQGNGLRRGLVNHFLPFFFVYSLPTASHVVTDHWKYLMVMAGQKMKML